MSALDQLDRPLGPIRKAALVVEILVLYLYVRATLGRRGVRRVVASLQAPSASSAPQARNPAVAYRLAWTVERVLARLPMDSRCLWRALVVLGVLGRRSIEARLVIGVREADELVAHAWVERYGRPLLSPGSDYRRLTEL